MLRASDGNLRVIGHTWSLGIGNGDFFVAKLSELGDLEWATTFGGGNPDFAYAAERVSDGYAIAGYSWSFALGQKDTFFLKVDSSGEYTGRVLSVVPTVTHPEIQVATSPFVATRSIILPSFEDTLALIQHEIDFVDACQPLYLGICEGRGRALPKWRLAPGGVVFASQEPVSVKVYLASGQLVRRVRLLAGGSAFVPLKSGVYFWTTRHYSGRFAVPLVIGRRSYL